MDNSSDVGDAMQVVVMKNTCNWSLVGRLWREGREKASALPTFPQIRHLVLVCDGKN